MDELEYKYDIAISFVFQDEAIAVNLTELLKETLKCFIYTEQQKKLAGTDGELEFNKVFAKESRIVVILHRKEWGTTKWTRIEETAIRNRGYEEGYDFVLLIPLDENPNPPKWLPKNKLWIGLKRWGIKSAASVIEARAQEKGSIIKSLSLADKVAADEAKIRKHEEIQRLLDSPQGRDLGQKELEYVIKLFNENVDEIKAKASSWHLHLRENRLNGIDLLSFGFQLSVHYYPNASTPYIFFVFSNGYFDINGYNDPLQPSEVLLHHRYQFDINKYNENGWSELETRENYISSKNLVNYWLEKLMKNATKSRTNK